MSKSQTKRQTLISSNELINYVGQEKKYYQKKQHRIMVIWGTWAGKADRMNPQALTSISQPSQHRTTYFLIHQTQTQYMTIWLLEMIGRCSFIYRNVSRWNLLKFLPKWLSMWWAYLKNMFDTFCKKLKRHKIYTLAPNVETNFKAGPFADYPDSHCWLQY